MPSYDFICSKCNYKFDEYLSISNRNEPLQQPCPNCLKTECIRRHYEEFPTVGYDNNLKPSSEFKEIMNMVKNSGQVPKRYHENIDRACEKTGGRLGVKSTTDMKSTSHIKRKP